MNVFLSYSQADERLADEIRIALTDSGMTVWSPAAVPVGESFSEGISDAIKQADAFVVLIPATAPGSQWILLELGAAVASNRIVIPVVGHADTQIPALLRDVRYVDLSDANQRAEGIAAIVDALLDGQREPVRQRQDSIDLVEQARVVLEHERRAHAQVVADRSARQAGWQAVAVILGLIVVGTGVVVSLITESASSWASVAGAASALFAAAIGFALGADIRGRRR